jgi:hypothetical protein
MTNCWDKKKRSKTSSNRTEDKEVEENPALSFRLKAATFGSALTGERWAKPELPFAPLEPL